MLETPHVVVGAAIASKIPNPLISIPLALASHLVLEKLPHWNPHLNRETKRFGKPTKKSTAIAFFDVGLSLVTGSFIAFRAYPDLAQSANILACCLFAAMPDIIEAPYFFLNFRPKILKKWIKWQSSIQADVSFFPGMATQLITTITALYWIFFL